MKNVYSVMLDLPDHMRTTFAAIYRLGQCTASQISEQTRRARAMESSYANMLCRMGFANKARNGRQAVFSIIQEYEALFEETSRLSPELRKMLADDMATAFANRVKVLNHASQ